MNIRHNNLTIREATATKDDAEYIFKYRSQDEKNLTLSDVLESLEYSKKHGTPEPQHMIEVDGKIIGDIHYGNLDENKTAEIGIFLRDEDAKGKGYGTISLTMMIDRLLNYYGYEKILLNTGVDNASMRYIAENKFGLTPIIHEDIYQESLGIYSDYVEYELKKENWKNSLEYVTITE